MCEWRGCFVQTLNNVKIPDSDYRKSFALYQSTLCALRYPSPATCCLRQKLIYNYFRLSLIREVKILICILIVDPFNSFFVQKNDRILIHFVVACSLISLAHIVKSWVVEVSTFDFNEQFNNFFFRFFVFFTVTI